ncbi:MAG: tRNA pseudouridine(55) synthase TruB [Polyangiales bacterium]
MTANRGQSGVLVVDKAAGVSSHHVVALTRRALGQRKVGHAGTLDPMATGLMVLGVGQGTKLLQWLSADDKVYDAVIHWGYETDSLDAAGKVTRRADLPATCAAADVEAALQPLCGAQMQVPPAVSAIQVQGRRAYALARAGQPPDLPPRSVHLHAATLRGAAPRGVALRLHCSKGYYVRALARDLGHALSTLGTLVRLRRRRSGRFQLQQACSMSWLRAAAAGDAAMRVRLWHRLQPLAAAAGHLPVVALSDAQRQAVLHGRALPICGLALPAAPSAEPPYALVDAAGCLLAIATPSGDVLRVQRGFSPE